ncbi:phage/plasmid primase, P4 family [Methanosarcina sp. UBA5]|uniref:phage/plasmid primase, P4 family n=1 Tax=Methanosarcina sp. UBA5 TaxID=1915593 RepID=UPI0025D42EB3|nr:phage/plasmid primase, P4 family [Methanosarcina sp. UBA5]
MNTHPNFINETYLKPTTINEDSIPWELRSRNQWILFKFKIVDGKLKKFPFNVRGQMKSWNLPENQSSFELVCRAYTNNYDYSGIGFVVTENDPYICIDFDHIYNPATGKWNQQALEEITKLNSYTEFSPSGTGVHVFVKAKMVKAGRREKQPDGTGREMYSYKHCMTVTGNHVPGTPSEINNSQEIIDEFYEKWFPDDDKPNIAEEVPVQVNESSLSPDGTSPQAGSTTYLADSLVPAYGYSKEPKNVRYGISDFDVLEKCRHARNAERFNILYGGNWKVLGCYPSKSEADLALCSMFAAQTKDRNQIDRLFTGSGLYSEKWNRTDYKEWTISKALDRINEDPSRKYFSEGRFIVKSLADEIMGEYHFLTFDDTKETYCYKNGVYQPGGENLIARVAQEKLGNYSTRARRQETLSFIKVETLITRDSVGKETYVINLKNGLYDLKEDKFKPHTPKLLSILQLPVEYNENAECPMIDKFLSEIVSEEDIQVLLEWAGHMMIPDNRMEKAVMLLGSGSNGKSVLLNLLTELIGIVNTSGESLHKLEKDRFSVANLYGKLMNVCPDIAGSEIYDSSAFTTLTGNEKQIRGERKGQQAFYFNNTARLIFSANDLPPVKNAGYAYYRRWILIEFPNKFEGKNADRNLIQKITTKEELSGLLNKAIKALKGLLKSGDFSYHKTIEEVERMYRLKSDSVAAFADECLQTSTEDTLKAAVYDAYSKWCKKNGEKPESNAVFGKKLKKLGYQTIRGSTTDDRKYYWEGISINKSRL